jgi:hypothetical protein
MEPALARRFSSRIGVVATAMPERVSTFMRHLTALRQGR